MSSELPNESTNLPAPESELRIRGYSVTLQFFPEIKMERKKGHTFAGALSEYLSIETTELESHKWSFVYPLPHEPNSRFTVCVTPKSLQLDVRFPPHGQEWSETRFKFVISEFKKHFRPKMLLHSESIVRASVPVKGDARHFLSQHVMRFSSSGDNADGDDAFGRPIHVIGFRLFFPPVASATGEPSRDSAIDLRVESLMEDPRLLFLEAKLEWFEMEPWIDGIPEAIIQHIDASKGFITQRVLPLLYSAGESGGQGEE